MQAIIFYNPTFPVQCKFNCCIAHRRFSYPANVEDYLSGQGFLKLRDARSGHTTFTAITAADLGSIIDSLSNSLKFTCKREPSFEVKPYKQWDNPFMVMADWLCNTLFQNILKPTAKPKEINDKLSDIIGSDRINLFCSAAYDLPEELLSQYYLGNKDTFLEGFLLSRQSCPPYFDHFLLDKAYQNTIRDLGTTTRQLNGDQCKTLIGIADTFLEDRAYDRFGEVQQIIDIISRQDIGTLPDRLAYKYHDAGLRLANHVGNTEKGVEHYQSGENVYIRLSDKTFSDIRRYHEFINRSTVTDANEFAFQRANARLKPIEEKENQLLTVLGGKNEVYGKICGSMAQNYAFLRQYQLAAEYFAKARSNLKENDVMQTSYCAHLALEINNQKLYLDMLCKLFEFQSFPGYKRMVEICFNKNIVKMAFPFHLVLKGLLTFPPDNKELRDIMGDISKQLINKKFKNHPWVLIYTVLGRLYRSLSDMENAVRSWIEAINFCDSNTGVTFVMLNHAARAWAVPAIIDSEGAVSDFSHNVLKNICETFQDFNANKSAPGILNLHRHADFDNKIRPGWFDDVGKSFLQGFDNSDAETIKTICTEFVNRFTFNYW